MSAAQFMRSVRYTRPRQLAQRARRIVRCQVHDIWPWREAERVAAATPLISESPPLPQFSPRQDRMAMLKGRPHAAFLNIAYPLEVPLDWAPATLVELQAMNLHYMEYLEAVDDEAFARLIGDWIQHNPVGQRGSWRVAWNSFVVSLRTVVWMQQLVRRRSRLPTTVFLAAHRSLAEQVRFLERHVELDIGGNHLLKNAKALLWAGRYFSGPEADRWRQLGQVLLAAELTEQILPDGMHYELSPAYHLQVFADLAECAPLVDDVTKTRLLEVLGRMAAVVVDLTHPDGRPSLFNDGGLSMTYLPAECLDVARSIGVSTPPARRCFAYRDAGYFGLRSDDSYLLVDCGALGPDHLPAHGHGDALAFEWTLAGQRIIVDAGVLEYERGSWRDMARATVSHNTVTLDDADQSEFWAAFRVGRRARVTLEHFEEGPNQFRLSGAHNGYRAMAGSPRHRRLVHATPDGVAIVDEVTGGAGQSVRARLLLHPDVSLLHDQDRLVLRRDREQIVVQTSGRVTVNDAWWFPDFGVKLATRQIVIHYGTAPCQESFSLERRVLT